MDNVDRILASVRPVQEQLESPTYKAIMDRALGIDRQVVGVSALTAALGNRQSLAHVGMAQAFSRPALDMAMQSAFKAALGDIKAASAVSLAGSPSSAVSDPAAAGFTSQLGLSFARLTGASVVDGIGSPISAYAKVLDAGMQAGMASKLNEQYQELTRSIGGLATTSLQDALKLRLPAIDIALPDCETLLKFADIVDDLDLDDEGIAEFEEAFGGDDSLTDALDDAVPLITQSTGLSRRQARMVCVVYVFLLVSGTIFSLGEYLPDSFDPIVSLTSQALGATGIGGLAAGQGAGMLFDKAFPDDAERSEA